MFHLSFVDRQSDILGELISKVGSFEAVCSLFESLVSFVQVSKLDTKWNTFKNTNFQFELIDIPLHLFNIFLEPFVVYCFFRLLTLNFDLGLFDFLLQLMI